MKVIEYHGFDIEVIMGKFCTTEIRNMQEFFLYNLHMNNQQFICFNCGANNYRRVYYKPYEYICRSCNKPLLYGVKDFMLDFKTQIKWHKEQYHIAKEDFDIKNGIYNFTRTH